MTQLSLTYSFESPELLGISILYSILPIHYICLHKMSSIDTIDGTSSAPTPLTSLPFKPVTKEHILHCSYNYWHPKYVFSHKIQNYLLMQSQDTDPRHS